LILAHLGQHDGSFVNRTYGSVSTRMKWINALVLALGFAMGSDYCHADNTWGGSLALTSDYLVRGISRSNGNAALQLDLHYATESGLMAGVFASNTQIDPDQPRDAELDAFVGFVWSAAADWRGVVRATYYSYPWNHAGSTYNYGELDVNVVYRDLLELALIYSPDAPGYSSMAGPTGGGYEYGSAGLAYDLGRVALTASYVDTSNEAKSLYYIEKPASHWNASILYRF
jgi:uncharacterized protein (TIGR02001 family)